MKRKALIYAFIFFSSALLFNYINLKIEKSKLKNLSYQQGTIYNFTLVSKNSEKIIVQGKKLIDKLYFLEGYNITSYIEKGKDKIHIKADFGIFDKKNKIELKKNVFINFNKKIDLITDNIIIDIKKNIAYNKSYNKILAKKIKTTGKNIVLNLKDGKIYLEKVKTEILEE